MSEQKSLRETEIQEGKVISQGHIWKNEWRDMIENTVCQFQAGFSPETEQIFTQILL